MESKMNRRMSKEILEKTELLSINDLKSIDDFSYDKVEMIRGVTPENIKDRCLDLCKNYIGGTWLKQTVDSIEVKRLSGGLTNQLYYCGLKDTSNIGDVPQEVAIRLYGPKHFNNEDMGNERLTDMIIALMVSENKLGPRIYGIFEEGQIQNYIKHRHFRYDEQQNPKLAEQLLRKLAQVHSMDVPIKKDTNWLFQYFDSFYKKAYEKFDLDKMITEMKLETLKEFDVKKELNWLKKVINKTKSPIIFTHIDFRGTNCMVTEPNDEIILCDFEYSCYGYRGIDLGTMIVEWNLRVDELFKSVNPLDKYPDDNQIRTILKPYIEESEKIFGKKYSEHKINTMDQLVKETKVFSLVAAMFGILFCLKTDDNEKDGFPVEKCIMMEMAERSYKAYFQLKSKFIQDKICQ